MKVVSVNVGLPREVPWRGRMVLTGIFKDPVASFVPLRRLNLAGDAQADLSVHGGPDKAVYGYPVEHYSDWQSQLGRELPYGSFGRISPRRASSKTRFTLAMSFASAPRG